MDLRVGTIGLGWMGSTRAQILQELPGVELTICCDANPNAAERVPDGVEFTTDLEMVFQHGIDALVVSTPDGLHRDAVVAALRRGINVFCEKPLATTLADADAMIEAEAQGEARLFVGHTLRADPQYRALQNKVRSGELGNTIHATSRRSWPAPEGARHASQTTVARYLSVHELDALQWILGQPIESVYAEASGTRLPGFGGTAASIVATLRFANGAVATHECTWGLPDLAGLALGDCAMSVIGTQGAAYLHVRDNGVTVFGGAPVEQPTSTADELFRVRGAIEFPYADDSLLGLLASPYAAEMIAFTTALRTGEAPLTTSAEARRALAAVIALETSLETGAPCEVDGSRAETVVA